MSLPSETRFEDLLSRYLDERVDQREENELAQALSDDHLAARFLEMTTLNAEIAGLMAQSIPDAVMIGLVMQDVRGEPKPISSYLGPESEVDNFPPVAVAIARHSRAGHYVKRTLAIAACLSFLALAVYWFTGAFAGGRGSFPPGPRPEAVHRASTPASRVASVRGKVAFIDSTGEVTLDKAQSLKGSGKLQTVGSESRATFLLGDHTRVELAGDTSVEINVAAQRVFLNRGTLRAHVTKEKALQNLVFATENSKATVKGTTFALMWDKPNSMVTVTEGTVTIQRLRDGYTVQVNAGEYAHVENGGDFFSWPLRALPKARRERVEFSN